MKRALLLAVLFGCGASSPSAPDAVEELTAPTIQQRTLAWEPVADGSFTTVGLTAEDRVVVSGPAGVSVCADQCRTVSSDAATRIVTASDRGAWLLGESVVRLINGTTSALGPAPNALVDVALGDFTGLWWVGAEGLAVGRPGLQRTQDPTAADAAVFSLDSALVLRSGSVSERNPGGEEVAAPVSGQLLATRSSLYVWTDQQIARKTDNGWQRTALPFPPDQAVASPRSETVWLTSESALLRISPDRWTRYALPSPLRQLVVDSTETVWAVTDSGLVRLNPDPTTPRPTFEREVVPWLATRCTSCHSSFTDPIYFRDIARDALDRTRSGDMPRQGEEVPASDYALLYDWIRLGLP